MATQTSNGEVLTWGLGCIQLMESPRKSFLWDQGSRRTPL